MKLNKLVLIAILIISATGLMAQDGAMVGKGCEEVIKNAKILYSPDKETAANLYNGALQQGDCAKMWNAGSKGWAVQVKMMPPSASRKGRVSVKQNNAKTTDSDNSGDVDTSNLVTRPFANKIAAETVYKSRLKSEGWAKMWYDADKKLWIVATKKDGKSNSSAVNKNTVGNSGAPQDINVNDLVTRPFTNKLAAETVYKSRLKSEGWARMWYDADKKLWIVATKKKK